MNVVRKLVFLVVILGVIALSVGCQQSRLSEEEVKSIVEEEVARQLAAMDELTVSNLYIENEDGEIVAMLGATLADGSGNLNLCNADGRIVTTLGSMGGGGSLALRNADGEHIVAIWPSGDGGGSLVISNANGDFVVRIGSLSDDGILVISDKDGRITFQAP